MIRKGSIIRCCPYPAFFILPCNKSIGSTTYIIYFKTIVMSQQSSSFLGSEEQPLSTPTSDERTMAILCHVLCLVVSFIAPLVIYLVKKDESKFVAEHAKESLNFQITCVIICVVLFITIIGIFLLWLFGIIATILIIVATIRASEGKVYRYPFNIRLIR